LLKLLDETFTSDEEDAKQGKRSAVSGGMLLEVDSALTQEDSERVERNRVLTEKRI
jgi:hypothetical protein